MENLLVNATKGIQLLLQTDDPTLIVDGRFGKYTQKVYDSASPATQALANSYSLRIAGMSISALRSKFVVDDKVVKAKGFGMNFVQPITENKLLALIQRVIAVIPIMTSDDLLTFAKNEAFNTDKGGERIYDASSRRNVNGKDSRYGGLMQFDDVTWNDVRSRMSTLKAKYPGLPDIPAYSEGVNDPYFALVAAAAYAALNRKTVRSLCDKPIYNLPHLKTYTFTGGDYYAMHNQGAGGYLSMVSNIEKFKRTAFFQNQSARAKDLLVASAVAASKVA